MGQSLHLPSLHILLFDSCADQLSLRREPFFFEHVPIALFGVFRACAFSLVPTIDIKQSHHMPPSCLLSIPVQVCVSVSSCAYRLECTLCLCQCCGVASMCKQC